MTKTLEQLQAMGNEELGEYEKLRLAFENGAKKKGYSFDTDELGRYEDNWLQEAWENKVARRVYVGYSRCGSTNNILNNRSNIPRMEYNYN